MTKVYRLFVGADNKTKRLDHKTIRAVTKKYLKGASFIPIQGVWEGEIEPSLVIEAVDFEGQGATHYKALAKELKNRLNQDAVMVTSEDMEAELV